MNGSHVSFSFNGPVAFVPVCSSRLDTAVAEAGVGISRREARRLLASACILLNGRVTGVASRKVGPADRITVFRSPVEIETVAETADWVAVNKRSGIPTLPGRDRTVVSLLDLLAWSLRKEGSTDQLFPVQRLDTGTSGVVLFARSDRAAARLSRLLAGGEIMKRYLAIAEGRLEEGTVIDSPIVKLAEGLFGTAPDGREATTIVRRVVAGSEVTLADIEIPTGRTHQIRVHLASIGHPVIGDRKYNAGNSATAASRPMLHSWILQSGETGRLCAEPPADFGTALASAGIAMLPSDGPGSL